MLEAEVHPLGYGFDKALVVQSALQEITRLKIPTDAFFNSRTLCDVVEKHLLTKEKSLPIDLQSVRESHEKDNHIDISWIWGGFQKSADGLTEAKFYRAINFRKQ